MSSRKHPRDRRASHMRAQHQIATLKTFLAANGLQRWPLSSAPARSRVPVTLTVIIGYEPVDNRIDSDIGEIRRALAKDFRLLAGPASSAGTVLRKLIFKVNVKNPFSHCVPARIEDHGTIYSDRPVKFKLCARTIVKDGAEYQPKFKDRFVTRRQMELAERAAGRGATSINRHDQAVA